MAVERRCLGHFARGEEKPCEFLIRSKLPAGKLWQMLSINSSVAGNTDKIALKVWKCDFAVMDALQEITQLLGCRIKNLAHISSCSGQTEERTRSPRHLPSSISHVLWQSHP